MNSLSSLAFSSLFTALAAAALAPAAHAQPTRATTTKTLGVDGVVVLPTGDYASAVDLAFGALARVEVPVGSFTVTGRGGAIFNLFEGDSSGSLTFLPFYAGVKVPLAQTGIYFAAEAGVTIAYASVDTDVGSGSETETKLGATIGAGLRLGSIDVRGGLFMPDVQDLVGLMGSAGFDFASF